MDGIEIQKHDYEAREGLGILLTMAKQNAVAKGIGVKAPNMVDYLSGKNLYGVRKMLPPKHIDTANAYIHNIGTMLVQTHITEYDAMLRLKELGRTIRLTNFLQEQLGWTIRQVKMHMSDKACSTYGKFSAEDVQKINTGLIQYGIRLLQIHLVIDYSDKPVQENPQ